MRKIQNIMITNYSKKFYTDLVIQYTLALDSFAVLEREIEYAPQYARDPVAKIRQEFPESWLFEDIDKYEYK